MGNSTARTTAADRVRAAAIDLFFEQGYDRTSVRHITAALRLTSGALYNHFRSKEELLYSIISRTHSEAERVTADAILRAGEDPARQLAEVAQALTTFSATYRKETSISHAEWRNLPEPQAAEIRGSRLRLGHLVERLLERGIRTGVFQPTADNALLAKVLLSTWTEVGRWYHPGGHFSVPDLADEFAVLALRTAGAAAPISVERFAPA
ncbi:TetR/AcrR family transcriptional regulator [Amycolatopsis thermoflava]|uniref:TetR family transcriptional regulator n=1 Tax=Amycolatopsis thermoflava TaxID=84480 RepID=A0A3N2H396_9PSEU|nr:TetR/AcrR family transcriptional regulator [Amycolatopsis thermoflava]ROS43382.1 TetR family transcriptional regulator [Amycolatopsis thermoflava]